jgi:hypothetical protein
MRVVVHVDRLVLDGFPAGTNTRQLAAAVERGLSRLLAAAQFERWRGGVIEHVTAPGGGVSAAHRPEAIGQGIARAVSFGITAAQAGDIQSDFGIAGGEHRR